MSISESENRNSDFNEWIADEYIRTGAFTALVILVAIDERMVKPLCSTYLNVIGDEINWEEITILFAGSGAHWDGASFFPVTGPNGPLDNPAARLKLRELEARLDEDRLVLNEGNFFDQWGRRLKVEELPPQ